VSVAKPARENGINANMLFTWRRRYREQLQAETTSLIPVAVGNEMAPGIVATPSEIPHVDHTAPSAGTIEVQIGRVVVKVDGVL